MVTTHNLSEGNRNVRSASLNDRIPRDTSLFSLDAFEIFSYLHHRNYYVFLNRDGVSRQEDGVMGVRVGGDSETGEEEGGGEGCAREQYAKKPLERSHPDLIY